MEKSLKEEEARKFLEEIAEKYNSIGCFFRFEDWAKDYKGDNKEYLEKVVKYLQKKNSGGKTRILTFSKFHIEEILDETILQKSS